MGPLIVVATVPIAFRRQWPGLALVCTASAVAVSTMLGASLAPLPVIALPLYSLTVKYPRRQSLTVLFLIEGLFVSALLVAAALRPVQGDVTFDILLAGATWFVGDSVRTRRAYQAGLIEQEQERQRREMDRAQRAIVEERMEIARELHDVIAHSLSVIAIQSGVGHHVIDSQPEEARKALAAVEETSRSALNELRRVLRVLRRSDAGAPEVIPVPTLADLDILVTRVREAGVPVELRFGGGSPSLPQGLELSIYRIVQEALTNVVKHALSAPTRVCIQYGSDDVTVEIVNAAAVRRSLVTHLGANGTELGTSADRHGIIGMKERASAFGGSLSVSDLPDGGFRVLARLPLRDQP
jgi:signal transduction histidine kinase